MNFVDLFISDAQNWFRRKPHVKINDQLLIAIWSYFKHVFSSSCLQYCQLFNHSYPLNVKLELSNSHSKTANINWLRKMCIKESATGGFIFIFLARVLNAVRNQIPIVFRSVYSNLSLHRNFDEPKYSIWSLYFLVGGAAVNRLCWRRLLSFFFCTNIGRCFNCARCYRIECDSI